MSAYWVAVASAEHVRRGRSEGFMQVSHGKAAPLKRVKPGDRVVYYSPAVKLGGTDKLQAFTSASSRIASPTGATWGGDSCRNVATLTGRRPTKRRSGRCRTRWNLPPASRTGVINCASVCLPSAPRIFVRSHRRWVRSRYARIKKNEIRGGAHAAPGFRSGFTQADAYF